MREASDLETIEALGARAGIRVPFRSDRWWPRGGWVQNRHAPTAPVHDIILCYITCYYCYAILCGVILCYILLGRPRRTHIHSAAVHNSGTCARAHAGTRARGHAGTYQIRPISVARFWSSEGFDSSIILMLRGGILISIGTIPGSFESTNLSTLIAFVCGRCADTECLAVTLPLFWVNKKNNDNLAEIILLGRLGVRAECADQALPKSDHDPLTNGILSKHLCMYVCMYACMHACMYVCM